jgi:hypothetical protein
MWRIRSKKYQLGVHKENWEYERPAGGNMPAIRNGMDIKMDFGGY